MPTDPAPRRWQPSRLKHARARIPGGRQTDEPWGGPRCGFTGPWSDPYSALPIRPAPVCTDPLGHAAARFAAGCDPQQVPRPGLSRHPHVVRHIVSGVNGLPAARGANKVAKASRRGGDEGSRQRATPVANLWSLTPGHTAFPAIVLYRWTCGESACFPLNCFIISSQCCWRIQTVGETSASS